MTLGFAALAAFAAFAAPAQAGTVAKLRASFAPDRLGATTALTLAFRFSGGEEGVPAPLSGMVVRLPAGLGVDLSHAATCSASRLRSRGAAGCPSGSLVGRGHASLEVHAGSLTVPEESNISVFRGPSRASRSTIEIFGHGETPLDQTTTSVAVVQPDGAPYGSRLAVTVPPIPTLVFEPNASFSTLVVTIGGIGRRTGTNAGATVLVPRHCPRGGFPFAASFTFADRSAASSAATVPCP